MAVSEFTVPKAKKPTLVDSTIPDYFGTMGADSIVKSTRLPKIPGADPAIYQQFQDVDKLRATYDEANAPWFAAFNKSTEPLTAANAQELEDINSIYSPFGYQSGMQDIRTRRAAAMKHLDAQILADLTRTLGLGRVGSGGQAGAGLNSFLARMAAAESGKLRAAEATDAATQERTDLAALMAARTAAAGKRGALTDTMLARLLQPQGVATAQNTAITQALQAAIQSGLLNSMLGLANPAPG